VNPSQISQGKLTVNVFRYNPAAISITPNRRFCMCICRKGYARIIDIPIQWSTPNKMNPLGR
jgi:hypothetical protein